MAVSAPHHIHPFNVVLYVLAVLLGAAFVFILSFGTLQTSITGGGPSIVFTANGQSGSLEIEAGENVTFTWQTTNADRVRLLPGWIYGPPNGQINLTVNTTTQYTATANYCVVGPCEPSATSSVHIIVLGDTGGGGIGEIPPATQEAACGETPGGRPVNGSQYNFEPPGTFETDLAVWEAENAEYIQCLTQYEISVEQAGVQAVRDYCEANSCLPSEEGLGQCVEGGVRYCSRLPLERPTPNGLDEVTATFQSRRDSCLAWAGRGNYMGSGFVMFDMTSSGVELDLSPVTSCNGNGCDDGFCGTSSMTVGLQNGETCTITDNWVVPHYQIFDPPNTLDHLPPTRGGLVGMHGQGAKASLCGPLLQGAKMISENHGVKFVSSDGRFVLSQTCNDIAVSEMISGEGAYRRGTTYTTDASGDPIYSNDPHFPNPLRPLFTDPLQQVLFMTHDSADGEFFMMPIDTLSSNITHVNPNYLEGPYFETLGPFPGRLRGLSWNEQGELFVWMLENDPVSQEAVFGFYQATGGGISLLNPSTWVSQGTRESSTFLSTIGFHHPNMPEWLRPWGLGAQGFQHVFTGEQRTVSNFEPSFYKGVMIEDVYHVINWDQSGFRIWVADQESLFVPVSPRIELPNGTRMNDVAVFQDILAISSINPGIPHFYDVSLLSTPKLIPQLDEWLQARYFEGYDSQGVHSSLDGLVFSSRTTNPVLGVTCGDTNSLPPEDTTRPDRFVPGSGNLNIRQIEPITDPVSAPAESTSSALEVTPVLLEIIEILASTLFNGIPADWAIDSNPETAWIAGAGAPQSLSLDLGTSQHVTSLRLLTAQFPSGQTTHEIWVGETMADLEQVHVFTGITDDQQWLEVDLNISAKYIKIETLESPSWVAWREVEVYGN